MMTPGKDQSSRHRKKSFEKGRLWEMFRILDGKEPDRVQRAALAEELGLSETQIYKWFFDTKKKVEQDEIYAR